MLSFLKTFHFTIIRNTHHCLTKIKGAAIRYCNDKKQRSKKMSLVWID